MYVGSIISTRKTQAWVYKCDKQIIVILSIMYYLFCFSVWWWQFSKWSLKSPHSLTLLIYWSKWYLSIFIMKIWHITVGIDSILSDWPVKMHILWKDRISTIQYLILWACRWSRCVKYDTQYRREFLYGGWSSVQHTAWKITCFPYLAKQDPSHHPWALFSLCEKVVV